MANMKLHVSYDDSKTGRTLRERVFNTEEELLEDFFNYADIPYGARESWKGLCDMFYEDNEDWGCIDLQDRVSSIELNDGIWMNISCVNE